MKSSFSLAIIISSAFVVASSSTSALAADRLYGTAGPQAVKVETLSATSKLVSPTTGGPYPLIVASHGWSASGDNQVGWAKLFASYGFVVAVPSFPSPFTPDAQVNSDIIVGLANDLHGSSAAAHNVLTTAKIGLEGHSAGGLATTVAASKLGAANVGAIVLFDPVDKDDVGKAAYAKLCVPLLDLFAQSSSCNSNAGWRPFASMTTTEVTGFDVIGSTHCDGENDSRDLCGLACGGNADATRQKVYASYATAFFRARLANDAAAAALLTPASIAADTGVGSPIHTTSTCAASPPATPDAGASTYSSSSSSSSSGSSADAGNASGGTSGSTPTTLPDDAAAESESSDGGGCGCRTTHTQSFAAEGGVFLAALLAVFRRRQRTVCRVAKN